MKSYLDLVTIYDSVRRRQSRMTRLCIILAVFLVSVIFGMADMEIRSQKEMAVQEDGRWHVAFRGLSDTQSDLIRSRPEIRTAASYAVTNYRLDKDYSINGKKAAICGFEKSFLELFPGIKIIEGSFPSKQNEAVITKNAGDSLTLVPGDKFSLKLPDGSLKEYTVSGISEDTSMMTKWDAFGVFLNMDAYTSTFASATGQNDFELYVEFQSLCPVQKTLRSICTQLEIPESQTAQNIKLLGLMLQSDNSYILNLYLTAAILAVLVIVAGIFMITSSLNSQLARRTEFFGMLRCLGASPGQIIRFVRKESLTWCKTAVPAGLALSMPVIWGLCAFLKYISPKYFSGMPDLSISWIGLLSGAAIGILTVLLAAQAPAHKAAKVSPLTAVSGNAGTVHSVKKAAGTGFLRVPEALGLHHAVSNKKNLFLMSGSFAFTIILFLAFTTSISFMNHALTFLKPYTPDISIYCENPEETLSQKLVKEAASNPAVTKSYGRCFSDTVSVASGNETVSFHLISYESLQFQWARDSLLKGSLNNTQKGTAVLADQAASQVLSLGDSISIQGISVPVEGILSETPFYSEKGIIICSEKLFERITGKSGYSVLDLKISKNASEQDIDSLRKLTGNGIAFSDLRLSNQEDQGAYLSFAVFIYSFLFVIALIGIFNIINTMNMSASARLSQFGAVRATGMTIRQMTAVITTEAFVYVTGGILAGTLVGLPINRFLFQALITSRWGDPWEPPVSALLIIILLMGASIFPAVYGPAKRIRTMSVVDVIHEQ